MRNKALLIMMLTIAALIGGGGGAVFATPDWDLCHNGNCIVHIPSLQQTPYNHPPLQSNLNQQIQVILPDGTCNIIGHILPRGGCDSPDLVVSSSDYIRIQNNVAYMTVYSKDTGANVTMQYCPIANYIWNGETAYYQAKLLTPTNLYNLVVPLDCQQTSSVPEFGSVAMLVLVGAIISIIALSYRTGLLPRYT